MKMKKRNKDNRFDIDLDFGNIGEEYIQEIFDGNCWVEVKTERDIAKRMNGGDDNLSKGLLVPINEMIK
jgi:hypothetical protein